MREIKSDYWLPELIQMFMDAKYDRENPVQLAEKAYAKMLEQSMKNALSWRIEQMRRVRTWVHKVDYDRVMDELADLEKDANAKDSQRLVQSSAESTASQQASKTNDL